MTEPPTQHYPTDEPSGTDPYASAPHSGAAPATGAAAPYGAPYGAPATAGRPRNGMGVAALVLGIVALLGFWTVVLGILLGLLALIFGLIGRKRAKRGEATNGGVALAGAILGGIALVAGIIVIAAGAAFFVNHKSDIQKLNDCVKNARTQQDRQTCANKFRTDVSG